MLTQLYAAPGSEILRISELLKTNNTVLYAIDNASNIESIKLAMHFLLPEAQVLLLPGWDCLPYDRISPSAEVLNQRIETFSQMFNLQSKTLILTPYFNFLQKLPPKQLLEKLNINLTVGSKTSHQELLYCLDELGYVRSATANLPGEFAVRGGLIDIVTGVDKANGFRINFFGSDIDSIKIFDPETQASTTHIKSFILKPACEVILNSQTIECFKDKYHLQFGLKRNHLFETVVSGGKCSGMEHLLPLFYQQLDDIFTYLPTDIICVGSHGIFSRFQQAREEIEYCYNARSQITNHKSNEYVFLPPNELYLELAELQRKLKQYKIIEFTPFVDTDASFAPAPNFYLQATQDNTGVMHVFNEFLKSDTLHVKKKKVICCFSAGSLERLSHMLHDHDITVLTLNNWHDIDKLPSNTIGLAILPLEQGISLNEILLISEQDLLGIRLSRAAKKKTKMPQLIQELSNFEHGELVVHNEHGIGRFEGLETLEVQGILHDFIKLIYAGDDKLYVPVENIDILTKYGNNAAMVLDKLGSVHWQHRKAKLKNKLKMAAAELLKIAAERETRKGIIFEPTSELYEKFCEKFLYVETEDQQSAIEDVSHDLASGKPMDRLVCGDVGFGKTEVALRAAAMVTLSGEDSLLAEMRLCRKANAQVAVIVPTTLLARQHYKNFAERFSHLPIKVAQLSRFVSRNEMKHNKQAVANGEVDIIIGTHALLANDIKFQNLGMIIIDEEQHFGVAQKEKLKKLKANTHILTLSATPIPRTLQLSISGIKELSLISTPPIDRMPIKTSIMPFDGFILREAIMREKARGGRIFVVTPRISYLNDLQQKLMEITPEIKMVQAHGQLPAHRLDQIMNDFYDGQYDLLISTSIVESGLDIPFANTIIIDRADMFGLAQLYQIRGRVGRSNAKAYAYLLTTEGSMLNGSALKRLEVIKSLDSLGVGFSIATHDMDIRGYGNLVGEEQSGHIRDVGIELYQAMLTEAIENLKNEEQSSEHYEWSPVLNIGISIQIPEEYITDHALRLSIYRKIAALDDLEKLEAFAIEMIDRFGPMPDSTKHLFGIIKMKQLAKAMNIAKIDCGTNAVVITFRNGFAVEKVLDFISKHAGDTKLRPDGKLLIMRSWNSDDSKLKGIANILQKLLNSCLN